MSAGVSQMSTQAGSQSVRFSDLNNPTYGQTEGATYKPAFKTFYTSNETQVQFESKNNFKGRSSYFSYYPTSELAEQKLEQVWFQYQNKKLADKRRDEETQAYIREWAQARGRMEAEIQRRKEHLNEATNFEKARGFVRTNWKTKNWNPNDDPTCQDSSTDSEDEAVIYQDEHRDTVAGEIRQPMSPTSNISASVDQDNISNSMGDRSKSLNLTRQAMSDTKGRKRR